MVNFPLNQRFTSLGLRAAQLVLGIIVLGLGAGISSHYTFDRVSYSIFVGVVTFLWIALLFVPAVAAAIPPLGVFIAEVLLWIFWLAQFAAMADVYGSGSCNFYYYGNDSACQMGKASIAMGVINWLLFSVSLGLFVVFTLVPSVKSSQQFWRFARDPMVQGSIFLADSPVTATTATTIDPEVGDVDPEPKVESLTDEPVSEALPEPAAEPTTETK